MDRASAYQVAKNPAAHSRRDVKRAHLFLLNEGNRLDWPALYILDDHLNNRPRGWRAVIFGVLLVVAAVALIVLVCSLVVGAISSVDWDAVLRFIAPTAFETRPIEEIIEGARVGHE